ncbi:MAG: NTP transferase domain-containing protein, partial [Oscillospiraceae bacterium]|nr:NTP transferase domain-containing protein [Oscillospiraceae bacterium]
MKKTALIMAGGRGERFWPKSRKNLPKQFLSLTDDGKTMIQLTVERILPLVDMEDIYIATNRDYKALVQEQLPGLPEENILCEPVGKNTAPCIGLGAIHMQKKYGDAVMMVLPSDHLIKYTSIFTNTLSDACEIAEQGENLVTIGITPDCPETGYG